jgi:ribA/ribD-fused uncharacterized protein
LGIAQYHKQSSIVLYFYTISSKAPSIPVQQYLKRIGFKGGQRVIEFYDIQNPFYEFTNFYEAPITVDGKVWPTSEHYFQAQKFKDPLIQEVIRKTPTARGVFILANSATGTYKNAIRPDWSSVSDDSMFRALMAKFTQYPYLRDLLLGTGDALLIEASLDDTYWGIGKDGSGKNRLGYWLMKVRDTLKQPQPALPGLPMYSASPGLPLYP